MTFTDRLDDPVHAIALRRRTAERRRAALENLRRLAVQLDGASALDRRADRSNPTLAAVLRERADERRRIAEVVRAHLHAEGLSPTATGYCRDRSAPEPPPPTPAVEPSA